MLFGISDTEKDFIWCTLDCKKDKTAATMCCSLAIDAAACITSKFPLENKSHTVDPVTHC